MGNVRHQQRSYRLDERKCLKVAFMEQNNIPAEFADFYFLRGGDLKPERFSLYPYSVDLKRCRELYMQGWIFHTEEDAWRVREYMRRAYVDNVMQLKGSDSIVFVRPLCP